MAGVGGAGVRAAVARADALIRVDAAWFAVEPLDMRAGVDKALAAEKGQYRIVVFDQPWKNVVATFYHELNEARTDADVEDAIRAGNDFPRDRVYRSSFEEPNCRCREINRRRRGPGLDRDGGPWHARRHRRA
jgi:hypothetical protein